MGRLWSVQRTSMYMLAATRSAIRTRTDCRLGIRRCSRRQTFRAARGRLQGLGSYQVTFTVPKSPPVQRICAGMFRIGIMGAT